MNIYIEIFGYIGTLLVIISMTMKSINRLRAFNIAGSIISMIYCIIAGTWPTVVMNVCLITVNTYQLIHARKEIIKEGSERNQ